MAVYFTFLLHPPHAVVSRLRMSSVSCVVKLMLEAVLCVSSGELNLELCAFHNGLSLTKKANILAA